MTLVGNSPYSERALVGAAMLPSIILGCHSKGPFGTETDRSGRDMQIWPLFLTPHDTYSWIQ